MIKNYPENKIETNYRMAEFFVLYKYRKIGIGTYTAHKIKGKQH
jgi:predicted acetyltransferase